jgi:hypothetical protein
MTPTVALALLAAYFLVSAETFLATHSVGIFRLSFAGIGPTELRILLAIGAAFVARQPWGDRGRPSRAAPGRRRPRHGRRARPRVRGIRNPERRGPCTWQSRCRNDRLRVPIPGRVQVKLHGETI